MAKLARVITVSSLLVLFGAEAFAQDTPTYTTNYSLRKWTEGQYPTADSISANWDELDSLLNTKLTSSSSSTGDLILRTAQDVDGASTGNGWLEADNQVNFYPFTVPVTMTPDSVYFFTTSGNASNDTLYVSIHSFDGATQYCHSGPMISSGAVSNLWWRAAFTTTAELTPGEYIIAYASPNAVTSTAPTTKLSYIHSLGGIQDIGGTRRIGEIANGLVSGSIQSNLQTNATASTLSAFPFFVILAQ